LSDVYKKLSWAERCHDQMVERFEEFAAPGGGDERPFGIQFAEPGKPRGLVLARFIVERPMPIEMALLSADAIHNARVALDHILARLKDRFGGDPGRGSFPTWKSEAEWKEKVVDAGRRSSLHGLDKAAVDLVYREQPLHQPSPAEDPLVVLNNLDNADKHRLLYPSFVYPGVATGLELIEVRDPRRVRAQTNAWTFGKRLDDGTLLAHFLVQGRPRDVLGAASTAPIGFATGELGAPRVGYIDMIDRVRAIADAAQSLIDGPRGTKRG
jgi:hypothetical protein